MNQDGMWLTVNADNHGWGSRTGLPLDTVVVSGKAAALLSISERSEIDARLGRLVMRHCYDPCPFSWEFQVFVLRLAVFVQSLLQFGEYYLFLSTTERRWRGRYLAELTMLWYHGRLNVMIGSSRRDSTNVLSLLQSKIAKLSGEIDRHLEFILQLVFYCAWNHKWVAATPVGQENTWKADLINSIHHS